MADDDDDDDDVGGEDGADGEAGESSSSGASKKKLFIIIGLALLLVVGGVGAAYFTGLLEPVLEMLGGGGDKAKGEGKGEGGGGGESGPAGPVTFFELPEMLVNLNTGGRKSTFLKIRISLELANAADLPAVEALVPRVVDGFQVYLRELRVDDLKGSAGMYRLREELLARVNASVAPAKVKDVLFKEMLVQ